MRYKFFSILFAALLVLPNLVSAAEPQRSAVLYKNPQCGCCEGHAEHLRQHGYSVDVKPTHDLPLIKKSYGVPEQLSGCHTTVIGGYVIEGHVPAKVIDRLLAEKPDIKGISMPGMPTGSPGMPGPKTEPFVIYELKDGKPRVYATE